MSAACADQIGGVADATHGCQGDALPLAGQRRCAANPVHRCGKSATPASTAAGRINAAVSHREDNAPIAAPAA
jgi:hypothetical protein